MKTERGGERERKRVRREEWRERKGWRERKKESKERGGEREKRMGSKRLCYIFPDPFTPFPPRSFTCSLPLSLLSFFFSLHPFLSLHSSLLTLCSVSLSPPFLSFAPLSLHTT